MCVVLMGEGSERLRGRVGEEEAEWSELREGEKKKEEEKKNRMGRAGCNLAQTDL